MDIELYQELKNFYQENGLLGFVQKLQVEIISDISACFNLWEEFSPKKSFFDLWEVRAAFYKIYQHKPYFLLLKNNSENLGLVPLWFQEDKQTYFWFGGWWNDDNKFFVKNLALSALFSSLLPRPCHLNCIDEECVKTIPFEKEYQKFSNDEPKYILNIENFKNIEDYFSFLKKNYRHNLRKDKRRIERQNPKVIINRFSDFDKLVSLSQERFKQKEERGYKDLDEDPGWADQRLVNVYKEIIQNNTQAYDIKLITVEMNDKIAGVDLIAIYNGCYYCLCCGYDIKNFPGIGNYFNMLEIEDAISLGLKKIDFLQNNYSWKDKFFQAKPTFIFVN